MAGPAPLPVPGRGEASYSFGCASVRQVMEPGCERYGVGGRFHLVDVGGIAGGIDLRACLDYMELPTDQREASDGG
jgi:hypothetical protein